MKCTRVHARLWSSLQFAKLTLVLAFVAGCSGQILIMQPEPSGDKTATQAITACNALNLHGVCNNGDVCVQGICYSPTTVPTACGGGVNGVCSDAAAACVSGSCTAVNVSTACSPNNITGLCPGGQLCVDGWCFVDDGTLLCSATTPLGACPADQSCTSGACATFFPTCNQTDFSGRCATWKTCSEGVCVGPVAPDGCSVGNPLGRCPAAESCMAGTCTAVSSDNACNPNNPSGLCSPGSACSDNGHCMAVTTSNICSPQRPQGLCAAAAICRDGTCVQPLCGSGGLACPDGQRCSGGACVVVPCDPVHPSGACIDSTQACVAGVCEAPTCSAQEPNGLCEQGLVCNHGVCTLPPCALSSPNGPCPDPTNQVCSNGTCILRPCSVASPEGSCPLQTCTNDPEYGCIYHMSAQCCDANLQQSTGCAAGQCAPPACSPQNPNGACATGYCVHGACHAAPCSPFYPGGYCTDANQQCVQGGCAKVGCATQGGDPNVFCDPYVCDNARNICVQAPCSPAHTLGSCPAGTACCSTNPSDVNYDATCSATGSCIVPTCSSRYPGGHCPDPNSQVCAAGTCTTPPCSSRYPNGTCGPNFACDANRGACNLLPCAQSQGRGYCPSGQTCDTQNGNYVCVPYECGNEFPQGPCIGGGNLGKICTNVGVALSPNYICVQPPCSTTYPGGACLASGTLCSNGNCVPAGCGPSYPTGVCPRSQTCTANHCILNSCATADPNDNGTCPSGQVCCNNALIASGYCNNGDISSCVATICSAQFPFGACTDPNQICVSDSGGVGCRDVCGAAHPTGYCPGGFACVERACAPPCANDQDCDTISDSDEGIGLGVDTNGDGVPDAYSHDSDGDTIPDSVEAGDRNLATPPVTTLAGGVPNFRSLDSDGDTVADTVEAGAIPGVPLDTDADGKANYVDTDSDGDGILDHCEAIDVGGLLCTNSALITSSAGLADSNHDGVPDMLSLDSDGDHVPDTIEARSRPAVPNTLNPNGIAHNVDRIPDYRNLDSDGDGVMDTDEDINGNGIVDCQVDGNNTMVLDPRANPACGTTTAPFGTYPGGQPYDYNPGCPSQKCLFAETNRVFADTDGNGISDDQNGVFFVCSAANLKPVNVFYSQQADYALALEQTFAVTQTLKTSGTEIGITFDDQDISHGSYPVSGLLVKRTPATAAIQTTGSTPAQALINKALAQAQVDITTLGAISGNNNVTVVLSRNTTSFDGYGVVITRYEILTAHPVTTALLRDRIALAFAGAIDSFTPADGGPTSQDFILTIQTVYRYDNGTNAGVVLSIGALAPAGANKDDPSGYNYRTLCSAQSNVNACTARTGCAWSNNTCGEDPTYQIPLFYADNITNGSALTQFGDDLAALCQSLVQSNGLLDILWTVDNSGSMADKIGQVVNASALFFPFMNNSEADYRVGMTTTATNSPYWQPQLPGCYGLTSQSTCANSSLYSPTTTYGGCTWLSASSKCVPMCSNLPLTGNGNCLTQPGCVVSGSACVWGGCRAITSRTTCAYTNNCTWTTANTCELVGTADLINGTIAADFTGAVGGVVNTASSDRSVSYRCIEGCTITACNPNNATNNATISAPGYTTANACNAHLACTWDTLANQCVTNCCPACLDNPNAVPNDPACYFAARLPNDDGSGNEFGLFMTEWALYRAGAVPKCAAGTNAGSCAAITGCYWDAAAPTPACIENFCATGVASNQNNADNAAWQQCNGWPTTSNGATITPPVPSLTTTVYNNPAAAQTPANCEWNPITNACYPSLGPAAGTVSGISNSQRCNASTSSATCNLSGCQWVSTGGSNGYCVPFEPPNSVLCNGSTQNTCTAQGTGFCQWDTCGYTTATTCLAVNGCKWSNNACSPVSGAGACRPPLRRMMRNNATKVAIIVSDEEECFVKDGPNSNQGGNKAYDGSCAGGQYTGGLLTYNDPVRLARTASYTNFLKSRDVLTFGLVGDAANTSLAPAITTVKGNGGCFNASLNYSAEAGQAYISAAQGTGGGWGSICAQDLFPAIESIGIAGLSKASPYKLEGFISGHTVQPISSTIKVATQTCLVPSEYPNCVSGTKVTVVPRSRDNGFDYDATNNALLLYGAARPVTSGSITVSYRYWVNNVQPPQGTAGGCPCPATASPNCQCPPGQACGAVTHNGVATNVCTLAQDSVTCAQTPGCTWNTANNGFCEVTGLCEPDPTCGGCPGAGQKCDATTGLCICDVTCGGPCAAGSTCDNNGNINACSGLSQGACTGRCHWDSTANLCLSATCGQCVCDVTCGGGCPAGQRCNSVTASPTCGQCACDLTCGGSCPVHEACNNDPNSPTCGLCQPPACGNCPVGYICSPTANICVCDVTCGGGTPPPGQMCDTDPNSATCGTLICDRTCGGGCPAHEVCNTTDRCGFCEPDPTCGRAQANCNVDCSLGGNSNSCVAISGCHWKLNASGDFNCYPVACQTCDQGSGLCTVDTTCSACGCNSYETCQATTGKCVCDTTCHNTTCPTGTICNRNEASSSCGQCMCDTTCGGPCQARRNMRHNHYVRHLRYVHHRPPLRARLSVSARL